MKKNSHQGSLELRTTQLDNVLTIFWPLLKVITFLANRYHASVPSLREYAKDEPYPLAPNVP